MFDEEGYRCKTGSNLTLNHASKEESERSRRRLMSEVSTKDLLEFTPNVGDVFESCKLRQASSSTSGLDEFFGKVCNSGIKVQKYLSNTDCCLRIKFPRTRESVPWREITFDPSAPGIVRSVMLNNTVFGKVASFKIFYSLLSSTGYKELERAPSIDRGYNYTDGSAFYNHFGIRHHVVSSTPHFLLNSHSPLLFSIS